MYQSKIQVLVHKQGDSSHAGLEKTQPEGSRGRVEDMPLSILMIFSGSTVQQVLIALLGDELMT